MIINWREYWPSYKGDVIEFARLLGCQEDIEEQIRKIDKELSEKRETIENSIGVGGIVRTHKISALDQLNKRLRDRLKCELEKLEEFKMREDINYRKKSDEHELGRIIKEFIEINGEYSIYKVSLYADGVRFRELETDDLSVWIEDYADEYGSHYVGTYLTLFFGDFEDVDIFNKCKRQCDIIINDGDIIYDSDNLVLITKQYDLILEIKERKFAPKIEYKYDEECIKGFSIEDFDEPSF